MRHLGHDRFSVVGHDRGALVAFRTAMDHPDAVKRLVVMDGLPVIEHLERLNEAFARTWWHWWFLGQTDKPAEAFISADPGRWYRTPAPAEMGEGNYADVWAAFGDRAVVHGMCEDYRAGLRVDLSMRKPTGPQAGRSGVRCCCSSRRRTTWTSTAIPRRSGGRGRRASFAAARSTPGITRPNRRRTNSPRRSWASSGVPVLTRPLDSGQQGSQPRGSTAGQSASPRKLLMARLLVAASPCRAAGAPRAAGAGRAHPGQPSVRPPARCSGFSA